MKKISISNKIYHYYDISETERIEDFPYSLRVLLESLIRQKNDENINQAHIQSVKDYLKGEVGQETVFLPSRVVLQDFTGVPAIVDLAA
ncbi:aconitate hydratase AcnA, partial [Lactococcus lactis]|nr:aconitate hydratase AcnA [Lactococcus lactis]